MKWPLSSWHRLVFTCAAAFEKLALICSFFFRSMCFHLLFRSVPFLFFHREVPRADCYRKFDNSSSFWIFTIHIFITRIIFYTLYFTFMKIFSTCIRVDLFITCVIFIFVTRILYALYFTTFIKIFFNAYIRTRIYNVYLRVFSVE